jgi:fengycin family lipopeptide synthetase B
MRTPNNIAVVYRGPILVYRELNEKASQLVHYLKYIWVDSNTLIDIVIGRSLGMVVGILGILKADGDYPPLGPTYSQKQLQFMLDDAKAPVLIVQFSLKFFFTDYSGIISASPLGQKKNTIQKRANAMTKSENSIISPQHLACVIYALGSSGISKGVQVKNIVFYIREMQKYLRLKPTDSHLRTKSVFFHLLFCSYFYRFISGAVSIITTKKQKKEPANLLALLSKQHVTILGVVPSLGQMCASFLKSINKPVKHKLGLILSASEALPIFVFKAWNEKFDQKVKIVNIYTFKQIKSVIVSMFDTIENKYENVSSILIHNAQFYLLYAYFEIVSIGEPGEIYTGKPNLAKSYLNRPNLTAEKFIPNPFIEEEWSNEEKIALRLYLTGEVAQYITGGNIKFLGRIDNHVKIRGFLVELGKIESVLNAHGDIKQNVILGYSTIVSITHFIFSNQPILNPAYYSIH